MTIPSNKETKIPFGETDLIIKTGGIANQAGAAVIVEHGETVILVTATCGRVQKEGMDYFPLSVEYEERLYAAGKISGSKFLKREGRPSEDAVLKGRIIDRSIRPLFPKYFRKDVQIIVTTLAFDEIHDTAAPAVVGASFAAMMAGLPFKGPIAAVKVAYLEDKFILNPTNEQSELASLELVVSGTANRVTMIEANANVVADEIVEKGIQFAHDAIKAILPAQIDFVGKVEQIEAPLPEHYTQIGDSVKKQIEDIVTNSDHNDYFGRLLELEDEKTKELEDSFSRNQIKEAIYHYYLKFVRKMILEDNKRPDGRGFDEIRPLDGKVGILPRVHGSGLFTRGQTQSLTVATLASPGQAQWIDTLEEDTKKRYMHHYNFPPYSTGETGRVGASSRREIGHGALAEKALVPLLPSKEDFPYTIRLVSEILSSNGSSSMASVCGSSLALMDAGVPIKKHCAGVAMGLVTSEDAKSFKVLTDLQGLEDFAGDMDFKIAGTDEGITAIQLDVKIEGLTPEIIKQTISDAKVARMKVLDVLTKTISSPNELSQYAPRIISTTIDPTKIGELIGPGGKTINKIIDDNGGQDVVTIDIEDDGTVMISSRDSEVAQKVKGIVESITMVVEVGQTFEGEVIQIMKDRATGKEIGAIVQIGANKDGMVHISALANARVEKVSDVVKVGDKMNVKVVAVDAERGRISLAKEGVEVRPPRPGGNGR